MFKLVFLCIYNLFLRYLCSCFQKWFESFKMQIVRYLPSSSVIRVVVCVALTFLLAILLLQQVTQDNSDTIETQLQSVLNKAQSAVAKSAAAQPVPQQKTEKSSPYDNMLLPALDSRTYSQRNKNGRYNTSIIVYTKQRCGSTFMSEPFNKHPDVFYIFEPLNQVDWDYLYVRGEADVLLRDTFGCNYRHMERISHDAHRVDWVQSHVFCQLDDQNPTVCDKTTRKGNLTKLEVMCQKHPYKATKIITMPGLHLLQPYINEGAKVIVNVRDPRGVIPSRHGIEPHLFKSARDYYNIAMVYCTEMLTDMHFLRAKFAESPWAMADAFHLVRYEDMAMDPVKVTREIYNFLNIPLHENVLKWAQGVAAGSNLTYEHKYGTQRANASKTAQGWKFGGKVALTHLHLIEDACRPLMKLLGYKLLHDIKTGSNSTKYRVDETIDYVGPFDRKTFLGL